MLRRTFLSLLAAAPVLGRLVKAKEPLKVVGKPTGGTFTISQYGAHSAEMFANDGESLEPFYPTTLIDRPVMYCGEISRVVALDGFGRCQAYQDDKWVDISVSEAESIIGERFRFFPGKPKLA